jgi:hypothetical protein
MLALTAGPSVDIPLDDALLDDRVSESIIEASLPEQEEGKDATGTAIEDALRSDAYAEGLLGLASEVIAERKALMGAAYPFSQDGNHIRYLGSKTHVYEFCLSISRVANIAVGKYGKAITVFEQLTGLAMSCFIGSAGQYYHTGYPGSGSAIAAHLPNLNGVMPGEWRWDVGTLKDRANDGGVDAVVWKKPDDRRDVGSLVFVGNSGCGRSWYDRNKHRERPSGDLAKILSRPMSQHLHDFLALPFHLYDKQEWFEASDEGIFVLDRIRLAAIAEAQDGAIWQREAARLAISIDDAIHLLNASANLSSAVN